MKLNRIDKKKTTKQLAKEIEKENLKPKKKKEKPEYLSSGCTMFNLMCTDTANGAFQLGTMVNLIGDSWSGKTVLSLNTLAEAAHDERFDDYQLIYDPTEQGGSGIDIEDFFGKKTYKRLIKNKVSETIEDFASNIFKLFDKGKKFIYVLDSFDGITTIEEQKRIEEQFIKGKDAKGSYKMEKAKLASELFRNFMNPLNETNSLLNIVSQTRDNIGFDAMFKPKTRAGGKALKFYSNQEIWLSCGPKIKKVISGLNRHVGNKSQAKTTKNRPTGKFRTCDFPILIEIGIDNIGGNIDFLLASKYWNKTKQSINTKDFIQDELSKAKLIEVIENENLETELDKVVEKAWNEIEEKTKDNRKKRYA